MTITCPSCEASYRVGPETLGAGRSVRCARCRTEWFAVGVGPAAAAQEPASLEPPSLEPVVGLDDALAIDAIESSDPRALVDAFEPHHVPSRAKSGSRSWLHGGARRALMRPATQAGKSGRSLFRPRPEAAVAALGLIAIGALIGQRVEVVRAAPSLASLYERIGLPVNVRGLTIEEVRSIERIEDGVPILLVSGVVRNVSRAAVETPRLKLSVVGDRDRELYAWTTVAARPELGPGESAQFRARLASPPAEGRGLVVRFVGQADLARAGR